MFVFFISSLPSRSLMQVASNDVILCTAGFLDGPSLARFSCVDRRTCHVIGRHPGLWQALVQTLQPAKPPVTSVLARTVFSHAWARTCAEEAKECALRNYKAWFQFVIQLTGFVVPYIWPCVQAALWTLSAWLCFSSNALDWNTLWVLAVSYVIHGCMQWLKPLEIARVDELVDTNHIFLCLTYGTFHLLFVAWLASPVQCPLWLVGVPAIISAEQQRQRIYPWTYSVVSIGLYIAFLAMLVWIPYWPFICVRVLAVCVIARYLQFNYHEPETVGLLGWCILTMVFFFDAWLMHVSAAHGIYSFVYLVKSLKALTTQEPRTRFMSLLYF
jgi:hypothetical protein